MNKILDWFLLFLTSDTVYTSRMIQLNRFNKYFHFDRFRSPQSVLNRFSPGTSAKLSSVARFSSTVNRSQTDYRFPPVMHLLPGVLIALALLPLSSGLQCHTEEIADGIVVKARRKVWCYNTLEYRDSVRFFKYVVRFD